MDQKLINIGLNLIKKELENMPQKPGVYRMLDRDDKVLYVGKAKDLSKRVANYTQFNRLSDRMQIAISQTAKLEIITTDTEAQALVLEANLIKSLKPKYNILLTDDKSMPYILIREDHEFSQVLKYRGKKDIKGKYFGPYASSKIVADTIEFLEKSFNLRNCSDSYFNSRKTPCLQYQIKRCSAPCVGKISKNEYDKNVQQALDFLNGKTIKLQQELSNLMIEASSDYNYERAAKYRDQLKALNYIQNKNSNLFNLEDADVIGIEKLADMSCIQLFSFRNGQNYGNRSFFFEQVQDDNVESILSLFIAQFYQVNKPPKEVILGLVPSNCEELKKGLNLNIITKVKGKYLDAINFASQNAKQAIERAFGEKQKTNILIKEVEKLFNITHPIKRIEVYDNSHISGKFAVGAMIVAGKEGFNKKSYRKYNIKEQTMGDDYLMLKEVLTRRFTKLNDENKPDLILIDGGQGHLNTAATLIRDFGLDIPLVCISKGIERNAGKEVFHQHGKDSFTLDKSIPVMKYLQILRDEAHRYAITSHRAKRSKAIESSSLTAVPGIGSKRKKALINHFTSIEEIANASKEQLMLIEGINSRTAEEIYNYFHNK